MDRSDADPHLRAPLAGELGAVAELLGTAMADNPAHLAAYGGDRSVRASRHTVLMRAVVGRRRGEILLGAFHGDTVVGFVAAVPTPGCRPGPVEVVRMLPALAGLGPASLVRVLRWQQAWARHHPTAPHLHVGPLAVHPDWRGRGLGRELLERVTAGPAGGGPRLPAYLETDREVNVGFYRSAGYAVVAEDVVLGHPHWFMERAG